MINFRYHIVSIASVFIALALGVIVGTAVINPVLVNNLRHLNNLRTKALAQERALNAQQLAALQVWESFGSARAPGITHDALKGLPVFLVEQEGTDETVATAIEASVKTAGALDTGRVVLLKKMQLADDTARAQLATDVGTTEATPAAVLRAAASALAARLATPGDPGAPTDLLGALQRDGFVSLRGVAAGTFPSKGSAIVYLWSGAADAFPDAANFAMPLLAVAPAGAKIAVVEPLSAPASLCTRVRSNSEIAARVASVDDVDLIPGQISLVAALRALGTSVPARHYGVKRGATAVVAP